MASITNPILFSIPLTPPQSLHFTTPQKPPFLHLPKTRNPSAIHASYEVGGGYTQQELEARNMGRKNPQETRDESSTWSPEQYEALLKGGEQVTSVLEEMANLVRYGLVFGV